MARRDADRLRDRGRAHRGGARALGRARRLDHTAGRLARGGRAHRGRRRPQLHRLRRRDRLPEPRPRPSRRWSPRSTSRSTATCTSASWSASTSRTWRSAAGSASCRRARAPSRRACSSTRAPRPSRTRSRSPAPRPAAPRSSSSTTRFHGRTLLTMTMTARSCYKKGFGPFAPEVYRAPAPYPYRGISTGRRALRARAAVQARARPGDRRLRRARAGAGRGRVHPHARRLPRAAARVCREHGILYVDDEVQSGVGRTGPRLGDRALRRRARPARLGQVARRRAAARRRHGPRRGHGRASTPGGLGGTFGGNPVACAAALAVLDEVSSPAFRARAQELGARLRARLDEHRRRACRPSARCAGSARCSRSSSCATARSKEPAPSWPSRRPRRARERGLILLSCGLYGNVDPHPRSACIADDDLDRGLEILEESLVAHAQPGA